MIKLAFFLVKYLFSNKYRVIIAFSSKIDYLCFRVIQLCEVWGIRLIDFRNQFVTHPFLSLILQFVNQRDSLNGNNQYPVRGSFSVPKEPPNLTTINCTVCYTLSLEAENQFHIPKSFKGLKHSPFVAVFFEKFFERITFTG